MRPISIPNRRRIKMKKRKMTIVYGYSLFNNKTKTPVQAFLDVVNGVIVLIVIVVAISQVI